MRLISTRNHTNPEGARFARARAISGRKKASHSEWQSASAACAAVHTGGRAGKKTPGGAGTLTGHTGAFVIHHSSHKARGVICEGLRDFPACSSTAQRSAVSLLRPEPSAPLASQCVSSSTQAPALSPPWQPRTLRLFESRTSFCETPPQPALMRSLSTVSHRQAELDATPGPG